MADALTSEKYEENGCGQRKAVLVVAGVPPIDLLDNKKKREYQRRTEVGLNAVRNEER